MAVLTDSPNKQNMTEYAEMSLLRLGYMKDLVSILGTLFHSQIVHRRESQLPCPEAVLERGPCGKELRTTNNHMCDSGTGERFVT